MCPRQGSNFLLLAQEKVTKEKGTLLAGRPRADCSALLGLWGSRRTHFAACGRCVQTGVAKSEDEARCACSPKALRCSTAHQGAQEKARLRHRVTPRFASARSAIKPRAARLAGVVSPFGRAEQRRALRERAQRASITSFGRLFERSAGTARSEFCPTRKDRAAQGSPRIARAEEAGVASLPPFLSIQERRSPAGANTRRRRTSQVEATTRSGTRLRSVKRTKGGNDALVAQDAEP